MTEYEAKIYWHGKVERSNPAKELADMIAGMIPNNSTFGMYDLATTKECDKKITTITFGSVYTDNRVKVVLEEREKQ